MGRFLFSFFLDRLYKIGPAPGRWGTEDRCFTNTWANAMGVWQDDSSDSKGVIGMDFRCVRKTDGAYGMPRVISSRAPAADEGKRVMPVKCQPDHRGQRWIVGLKLGWGGRRVGVGHIVPICQRGNHRNCSDNSPIELKNVTIPAFNYIDDRWKMWTEVKCDPGTVMCSINGKYNQEGFEDDQAGLTSIKIGCCPFPSPDPEIDTPGGCPPSQDGEAEGDSETDRQIDMEKQRKTDEERENERETKLDRT